MNNNPIFYCDGYKLDHRRQYPEGTELVYSNLTPRKSRLPGVDKIVVFGIQFALKKIEEDFQNNFFNQDIEKVCVLYEKRINNYLGKNEIGTNHIRSLHNLGYLPLHIKALEEGTVSPMGVPVLTIKNTLPEFFWLTNYLETLISCLVWQPLTSATIAYEYRKIFNNFAKETTEYTDNHKFFTSIQGHDFSFRGMSSPESAAVSGAGHLLSFVGTDTLPAIDFLEKYYNADATKEMVGISVPATEHSVMSTGQKSSELETFKRLITEVYPSGIVSIVSDTWDLWRVLIEYLPELKNEVIQRDGKVVIRPDSGVPENILCGTPFQSIPRDKFTKDTLAFYLGMKVESEGKYYLVNNDLSFQEVTLTPQEKGVVQLLWEVFGGTVNAKGYKELDPHIGCIYGDSITLDRAKLICTRLKEKGFASTNWVAGIGSFTYQYNTRDTFGIAMKATYVEVDGEGREIFKDPVTDDGMKKSAKGLLRVENGILYDQQTPEQEKEGDLKTVYLNKLYKQTSLSEIRAKLLEEYAKA